MKEICLKALRAFKWSSFTISDLATELGYNEGYVRNAIGEAVKAAEVTKQVVDADKRRRAYRVNPKVVERAVRKGGEEKEKVIRALGLEREYCGKYVALLNGKAVDCDEDLYALSDRVFAKHNPDEIVVTNVGLPKKIITIEI